MDSSTDLARLRASEEKYRLMVESAIDAILSIDTETGMVLGGNPQACAMTGYSLAELRALRVWQLHPEDERAAAQALFERVQTEGYGAFDDLHFLCKDGRRIAIDVRANVITYAGRQVIQRICRDITERKQREQALARRRRFEDIVLSLSTRFINIPTGSDGVEVIRAALKTVGTFAEVHRSYVYFLEEEGVGQMLVWGAPGIPAYDKRQTVSLEGFEWGLERLEADETVTVEEFEVYPWQGIEPTEKIRELAARHPCPEVAPPDVCAGTASWCPCAAKGGF